MDILDQLRNLKQELDARDTAPACFMTANFSEFRAAAEKLMSVRMPSPYCRGVSYAGIPIREDKELPDRVIEARSASGEVLSRVQF